MSFPKDAANSKASSVSVAPKKKDGTSKRLIAAAFIGALVLLISPALVSEFIGGWTRKYTSPNYSPSERYNMTGKVAIVTGANTGIGYFTALELARNGAEVIIASRSVSKGKGAVTEIEQSLSGLHPKVRFLELDLGSLKSVKQFAKNFSQLKIPLHVLVLNAGIMKSPGAKFCGKSLTDGFDVTSDGFERHIGVNHIGHFYLTSLLLDKLKKDAPSRVVSVSSSAEESAYEEGMRFDLWSPSDSSTDYEDGMAYGQSKLANLLFARELAERMAGTNVFAYSCHPGVIKTELHRFLNSNLQKSMSTFMKHVARGFGAYFEMAMFSAPDGAKTQIQLASSPSHKLINGAFYHPIGKVQEPIHPQGQNATLQKLLWVKTEEAIAKAK